jgi:hypothetical protein
LAHSLAGWRGGVLFHVRRPAGRPPGTTRCGLVAFIVTASASTPLVVGVHVVCRFLEGPFGQHVGNRVEPCGVVELDGRLLQLTPHSHDPAFVMVVQRKDGTVPIIRQIEAVGVLLVTGNPQVASIFQTEQPNVGVAALASL